MEGQQRKRFKKKGSYFRLLSRIWNNKSNFEIDWWELIHQITTPAVLSKLTGTYETSLSFIVEDENSMIYAIYIIYFSLYLLDKIEKQITVHIYCFVALAKPDIEFLWNIIILWRLNIKCWIKIFTFWGLLHLKSCCPKIKDFHCFNPTICISLKCRAPIKAGRCRHQSPRAQV